MIDSLNRHQGSSYFNRVQYTIEVRNQSICTYARQALCLAFKNLCRAKINNYFVMYYILFVICRVFGKIYDLPRQQVAYGDPGITYTYSGVTVPALPWPGPVLALRDFLESLKGIKYDFVLINK